MSARPTVAEHLASGALWAAGLGFLAVTLPPLTWAYRRWGSHTLDPWTRRYTRAQVAMTTCRWSCEVDPAVDPGTPYLFVQNHVNLFDYCTMYPATPHFKQGIELRSHFDIPFYGPFMQARGTIPVDRDDKTDLLRVRRRMREELDAGHSLLAFPEGTRTRDGRVGAFHSGLFHIARGLKVEIVPVAVLGMFEVLGTPSTLMRPLRDVHVKVLAPVPTAGVARDGVDALTTDVRDRIAREVDAWYAARGHAPPAPVEEAG